MSRRQEMQEELEWRATEALDHCAQGKPTEDDLALLAYLTGIQWRPTTTEKNDGMER
jgi:hypothetical protein